jgi:hypothetical protein
MFEMHRKVPQDLGAAASQLAFGYDNRWVVTSDGRR